MLNQYFKKLLFEKLGTILFEPSSPGADAGAAAAAQPQRHSGARSRRVAGGARAAGGGWWRRGWEREDGREKARVRKLDPRVVVGCTNFKNWKMGGLPTFWKMYKICSQQGP